MCAINPECADQLQQDSHNAVHQVSAVVCFPCHLQHNRFLRKPSASRGALLPTLLQLSLSSTRLNSTTRHEMYAACASWLQHNSYNASHLCGNRCCLMFHRVVIYIVLLLSWGPAAVHTDNVRNRHK